MAAFVPISAGGPKPSRRIFLCLYVVIVKVIPLKWIGDCHENGNKHLRLYTAHVIWSIHSLADFEFKDFLVSHAALPIFFIFACRIRAARCRSSIVEGHHSPLYMTMQCAWQ